MDNQCLKDIVEQTQIKTSGEIQKTWTEPEFSVLKATTHNTQMYPGHEIHFIWKIKVCWMSEQAPKLLGSQ